MKIELAHGGAKEQVKSLWSDCFGDKDPYLSWYFDNIYKDKNTVVATQNGEVVAAAQLSSVMLSIQKNIYNCSYICGVSVNKAIRKQGLGNRIMNAINSLSRSRGDSFATLVPVIDGFYEKNGYVRAFDRFEYCFDENALLYVPKQAGNSKKASRADMARVNEIYSKYVSFFDSYMIRDDSYFDLLRQQYENLGGQCRLFDGGYMLYFIGGGKLLIEEGVALDETAAKNMLSYIASLKGDFEKVVLRCGEKDVFSSLLNILAVDRRVIHNVSIYPFEMSKEKALQLCKNKSDGLFTRNFVNILL